MFPRLLYFPFSILMLVSTVCFADVAEVSTNEPDDSHLGMKIDLSGKEFVTRVTVNKDTFLLVDPKQTDIRVVKDAQTKLNHFNALVAYNLYEHGLKKSATRFVYLQCPIVRKTFVDRSKPFEYEVLNGKKVPVSYKVDIDNLKEEFVSPGFYKFLSLPNDRVSKLSNDFPMAGKVREHFDLELMCVQAELIYARYGLAEVHRRIVLEKFGLQ